MGITNFIINSIAIAIASIGITFILWIEIGIIKNVNKYGLIIFWCNMYSNFIVWKDDPIWKEPVDLIKMRDPRAYIRVGILKKFNENLGSLQNYERSILFKRILFCTLDKNTVVRRLACNLLKSYFKLDIQDIEQDLEKIFDTNFYLINKELKKKYLSGIPISQMQIC
ncbi:MAG: hypothetical protein ACTSVY_09945 [Candidatus Helarchaeota archaeon]